MSKQSDTRARNKERSDNWVIKFDEYHPDPQIAALFADINASKAVQGWYNEQLRRFDAKAEPTPDDRAQRKVVEQELKDALAEQARLEELAGEWYTEAA
jgi:hypothetical protein